MGRIARHLRLDACLRREWRSAPQNGLRISEPCIRNTPHARMIRICHQRSRETSADAPEHGPEPRGMSSANRAEARSSAHLGPSTGAPDQLAAVNGPQVGPPANGIEIHRQEGAATERGAWDTRMRGRASGFENRHPPPLDFAPFLSNNHPIRSTWRTYERVVWSLRGRVGGIRCPVRGLAGGDMGRRRPSLLPWHTGEPRCSTAGWRSATRRRLLR